MRRGWQRSVRIAGLACTVLTGCMLDFDRFTFDAVDAGSDPVLGQSGGGGDAAVAGSGGTAGTSDAGTGGQGGTSGTAGGAVGGSGEGGAGTETNCQRDQDCGEPTAYQCVSGVCRPRLQRATTSVMVSSGGGEAASGQYRLQLFSGMPQPMGSAASAHHQLVLGPATVAR